MNYRYDPARLLDDIFAHIDGPILLIENKVLYAANAGSETPPGFVYEQDNRPYATIRMRPAAPPDVTLVCYGGMLPETETAAVNLFDEHDIVAEIVCPTQLYPLDLTPILETVARTKRLVVVEEGQSFAAFGAEVITALVEHLPMTGLVVRRVAPAPRCIPSSGPMEREHLPGADDIVQSAREVVAYG